MFCRECSQRKELFSIWQEKTSTHEHLSISRILEAFMSSAEYHKFILEIPVEVLFGRSDIYLTLPLGLHLWCTSCTPQSLPATLLPFELCAQQCEVGVNHQKWRRRGNMPAAASDKYQRPSYSFCSDAAGTTWHTWWGKRTQCLLSYGRLFLPRCWLTAVR